MTFPAIAAPAPDRATPAPQPATAPSDTAAPASDATAPPCAIDTRLSLWLSLEAADRTIAALEGERLELLEKRRTVRKQLDLASGRDDGGEGLATMTAKLAAEAAGEDSLAAAYHDYDMAIVELDRTLERRRTQRARLEAAIDARLGAEEDAAR